jgi:hypothetical protein
VDPEDSWSLAVYYGLAVHAHGALDDAIEAAVGEDSSGSSASIGDDGIREVSFDFATEAEAREAGKRVEALGHKALWTDVSPPLSLGDPPGRFAIVVAYPVRRIGEIEASLVERIGREPLNRTFLFEGPRALRWLFDDKRDRDAAAAKVKKAFRGVEVRCFRTERDA